MRNTIETIVSVLPPIAATTELAGRKYKVHLQTGPAQIVLPLESSEIPPPTRPNQRSTWPPFPGKREPPVLRPVGMSVGATATAVPAMNQLNIDALIFRTDLNDTPMESGSHGEIDLAEAISNWLEIARSWIGCWTKSPQSSLVRHVHSETKGIYRKDGKWARFSVLGDRPLFVTGAYLVEPEVIGAAFMAASAQLRLPVGHEMLTRALTNHRLGDNRTCVIDACSAAEMALAASVRAVIGELAMDDKTREKILSSASGVVEVFRLFLVAHGSAVSMAQVVDQLAGPRNSAAHDGVQPTDQVATRALRTANLLLQEASPLPLPAEVLRAARRPRTV